MRDQCLVVRQVQPQLGPEEIGKLLVDAFGFVTGSDETQEEIVCVPNVFEAPIVWIIEHTRWQLLRLLSQDAALLLTARASQIAGTIKHTGIDDIPSSVVTSVERRKERRLDERVQSGKVDVGENGAHDAPLRRAARGRGIPPVFQVSSLEQIL